MTQVNRRRIASAVAAALLFSAAATAADTPPVATAPAPAAAPAATTAPATSTPNSFESAIINGKAHIDFRYRFETVDQDGFEDDAYASTLRSRLNYLTGDWHG